jgi:hypothetical protein
MLELTIYEVAQQPIPLRLRRLDGTAEEYQLPRLKMRDYLPILAALTGEVRKRVVEQIPKSLNVQQREQAVANANTLNPTLDDVRPWVLQPDGAEKVVRTSMDLAGVPKERQDAIIGMIGAGDLFRLAAELSTLFAPTVPPWEGNGQQKKGGEGGPNSSAGESQNDFAGTGSPTVPSSGA